MSKAIELLKKYITVPAVSGNEYPLAQLILQDITPFASDIKMLPLGGITGFKKGKKPSAKKLMIDAHMDEVGFIISGITNEGYLRFDHVGGIDNRVVFGKRVLIGKSKVAGVIGGCAVHLLDKEKQDVVPQTDDMLIDIGAKDLNDAKKHVKIGDTAVFDTEFICGENKIIGRALDDRVGCAILASLIMSESEYDFYFSFSVQEEVGCRGAATAAFDISPDSAIVLEATTAADIAQTPFEKTVCSLNGGAVVSFMDGGTLYDKEYFDAAINSGLLVQPKRAVAGGNNSATVHKSKSGVKTIAISLPCRYIHSGSCTADMRDIFAMEDLCRYMQSKICGGEL